MPVGTGSSLVQENMLAANILNCMYVVPFVRVVRSSDNALTATGVRFSFLAAALIASPDDENAKGTRFFVASGYDVNVTPASTISGAGVNGQTFAAAPVSGTVPALANGGGLILWKCQNLDNANVNNLRFEIHLIGRGP